MEKNNNQEAREKQKYECIATKVSPDTYEALQKICKRKGLNLYTITQLFLDSFVRYADEAHNLSADMDQLMMVFQHFQGWNNQFNIADPTTQKDIGEAIYFLQDATGKHKGTRTVLVTKPFFDQRTMTFNEQDIFETYMCRVFPEQYKRLRLLATDNDCESCLELINHLIDMYCQEDKDVEEIRKGFEDARRSEWGKHENTTRYVRHKHSSPDKYIQQELKMEEVKRESEEARQWLVDHQEDDNDRPYGMEW